LSRSTLPPATPFQLMPELPAWEYEALKESIRQYGVLMPVVRDESGVLIDGHHRSRACNELGIKNVPTITLAGLTEEQKRNHAIVLNLVRRKITRKQMREIIATELRRQPDLSNRWLAEIVGSTDKTIQSVRSELLQRAEIPQVDSFRGKDGKTYAVTRIYSDRSKQAERARAALATLGEDAPRKTVSLKQLEREAKKKVRSNLFRGRYRKPDEAAPIRLYHADFRELEEVGRIEPGTVDLVLTDPPYNKAFAANFDELAEFAARVLKPGGVFACYLGVIQMASAIEAFSKHLEFRVTAFSSWLGDGSVIQDLQCITQATPVVVFSKEKWTRTTRWYNVFHNEAAEQYLHEWQKPLADVEHWLLSFSDPDDLVCDPMAGSGTVAAACNQTVHGRRRFVGCDIDRDAIRIAQQRLKQSASQVGTPVLSLGKAK